MHYKLSEDVEVNIETKFLRIYEQKSSSLN